MQKMMKKFGKMGKDDIQNMLGKEDGIGGMEDLKKLF